MSDRREAPETEKKTTADERLDRALQAAGLQDPRGPRRAQLRRLKAKAPAAFAEAVRYYEEVLLPRVTGGDSDPVAEWTEYGLMLVRLSDTPGALVRIDSTGRAWPYEPPLVATDPVLHLPDDPREPATLISAPREPSPAQNAAIDLLIRGATALRSG